MGIGFRYQQTWRCCSKWSISLWTQEVKSPEFDEDLGNQHGAVLVDVLEVCIWDWKLSSEWLCPRKASLRWRCIMTSVQPDWKYYVGGEHLQKIVYGFCWLCSCFLVSSRSSRSVLLRWSLFVCFGHFVAFMCFRYIPTKLIMTGVWPLNFRPMWPLPQKKHWFPQGIHV